MTEGDVLGWSRTQLEFGTLVEAQPFLLETFCCWFSPNNSFEHLKFTYNEIKNFVSQHLPPESKSELLLHIRLTDVWMEIISGHNVVADLCCVTVW